MQPVPKLNTTALLLAHGAACPPRFARATRRLEKPQAVLIEGVVEALPIVAIMGHHVPQVTTRSAGCFCGQGRLGECRPESYAHRCLDILLGNTTFDALADKIAALSDADARRAIHQFVGDMSTFYAAHRELELPSRVLATLADAEAGDDPDFDNFDLGGGD